MAPILGIYASSASPNVYANSYESIATVTVGAGGTSSIGFSSIPSTYQHLQVRGILRDNESSYGGETYLTVNGVGTNYKDHYLFGQGSTAASGSAGYSTVIKIGAEPSASTPANIYGAYIIDFLDYANTSKYKTIRNLSGFDNNGAATGQDGGQIWFSSGLWMDTAAITSINIRSNGTLNQYSSFALYGIKS